MGPLAISAVVLGVIAVLVGNILLLIAAYREHILWLLGVLFLPFASLVFIIVHWNEAKRSLAWQVLGAVLAFGGVALSGYGQQLIKQQQEPKERTWTVYSPGGHTETVTDSEARTRAEEPAPRQRKR
jgi:hypothetical protein